MNDTPQRRKLGPAEAIRFQLERDFDVDRVQTVSLDATEVFDQAAKALDAGAYLGASVLCRSTLEAAFYSFLTRVWDPKVRAYLIDAPRRLDGTLRRVGFNELIKGVKARLGERHPLPPKLEQAVYRVQEHGNVAAHTGPRQNEHIFHEKKSWVTEEEAWEDFRDTASIIQHLAKATKGVKSHRRK